MEKNVRNGGLTAQSCQQMKRAEKISASQPWPPNTVRVGIAFSAGCIVVGAGLVVKPRTGRPFEETARNLVYDQGGGLYRLGQLNGLSGVR